VGFDLAHIRVLVPTHPAALDWANTLPEELVITLEPGEWRKEQLLDAKNVESQLAEYFARQRSSEVRVVGNSRMDELNAGFQHESKRGSTLKRVFEVQLRTPQGKTKSGYVLAKSVGLGYFGYPAFLAAHRLSEFVPPLLGLRNGILYTEWLPQQQQATDTRLERDSWIDKIAAYIAARTRLLALPKSRAPGKAVQENGLALLAEALGRAYARFVLDIPMRSWIQRRLHLFHCPRPTLIDGNMGRPKWIPGECGPLKTGYYGHALGKAQLNVVDPAYDLAETLLSFALSPEEEDRLIRLYIDYSGDAEVGQRLFINKLLAGVWTMESAQELLFGAIQTDEQQQEQLRRFLGAWDFLTVQTARFCGARSRPSRSPSWRSPLFMLDLDGVLDRRVFGYPCTTAAGMQALSLLTAGGYSIALNTARSAAEVRDYCQAYGWAGGVAEHGAYLWDAVAQCGQSLLDHETIAQLDELRKHLRQIPGIFLDDRHRYSIRAFIFEKKSPSSIMRMLNSIRSFHVGKGAPAPLPTLLVNHLLAKLKLDRLSFHHTTIDTVIVAKGVNKGSGLRALRDRVLGPDAETIAIGDTEADLPMFRSATRSFAPAQISCRRQARLLGCSVSRYRYQRGLLDIVRTLVDRQGTGELNENVKEAEGESLFLDLLQAADQLSAWSLVRALFDRATLRIFLR
jgi:hydroxymethylpyrimidine pyrophosphatase-like HAD family hydrolase